MSISQKIREIIKKRGITQSELSKVIGMTRNGFQKALENETFKATALQEMADHLNVGVNYFYENSNYNNENNISIVNDNKSGYGSESDFKKENAALKKEIKYLKEINELLKNK